MTTARIFTFRASDGYEWRYRQFDPTVDSVGRIVALHGIQSHGGWYEATNQWLVELGWHVSFLDRRGCGLNELNRGDCPSFRRLLDDIAEFVAETRKEQNGPIILMGISWGGKLAIALQKRHPGLFDGIVLITPGFKPKVRPRLANRIRIMINRFIVPKRMFSIPLNEPVLFTSDPIRQQFIANDPLALRQATARLLFESARMDVYLRMAAKRVRCPVLVLLAEDDRIINNKKTRKFMRRMKNTDVKILEFANAHHTMEFEVNGPPFYDALKSWFDRVISLRNKNA